MDEEKIIKVDFTDWSEEFEWIINTSKDEIRTPDLTIINLIREIISGKWEWNG